MRIYICKIIVKLIPKKKMLKHVVMWKFKDGVEGKSRRDQALWMKEHLEALVGVVPQIVALISV